MQAKIKEFGNSKGIIIPKPLLAQVGLEDQSIVDITIENGSIVLRKSSKSLRIGWSQAARDLNTQHADLLVLGEFTNSEDKDLVW
jgi:antitoxin MazE